VAYATTDDLARAARQGNALTGVSEDDKSAALDEASAVADSYLAARYTLPLTAWGGELTRHVINIALYQLVSDKNFNPQNTASTPRQRYEDAIRWLERVAAGTVTPVDVVDSGGATSTSGGLRVVSSTQRGW
jgi:phage gp36-like protein